MNRCYEMEQELGLCPIVNNAKNGSNTAPQYQHQTGSRFGLLGVGKESRISGKGERLEPKENLKWAKVASSLALVIFYRQLPRMPHERSKCVPKLVVVREGCI